MAKGDKNNSIGIPEHPAKEKAQQAHDHYMHYTYASLCGTVNRDVPSSKNGPALGALVLHDSSVQPVGIAKSPLWVQHNILKIYGPN
ncbi:hypothetical protein BDDG_03049 [Blastomyces dermatitidis ATCC 18188]|uniref:Uncharacterized protein n=1 Tax=Ajellomyces dermatitidis (strain ATCC 18188 / CBS 674.68) TaxID=653446 RepID=F2TA45_AJEDA|nr:hypothetical protein BDDG_03049 [Blastomyces dermatitidis ATCC 18188]EQL29298.1 hypothetical protein BDFG_08032 [Blastomyces dermatitidis ATCC 26199]